MVSVLEALVIYRILEYSSFNDSSQQTIIAEDGFESYDYILTLGDSDIRNLVKGFSDRTVAAGKISFGLRWTNLLKAIIHWAQDFMGISPTTSLIGISKTAELCAAIEATR